MKHGDKVLLDGIEEVELTWKGGTLALVKGIDAKEPKGVDLRRLSERGSTKTPEIPEQTDAQNLF